MMGLGQTSTTATSTPTFTQGLTLWESPSSALSTVGSLVSNASTAFSGSLLPFTLGVLLPPIALVGLLFAMGKGKR